MFLPKTNTGAALGGMIVTLIVFLLQALSQYMGTGQALPTTVQGWEALLLPSLVAGLLSILTPYAQSSANSAATAPPVVWGTGSNPPPVPPVMPQPPIPPPS